MVPYPDLILIFIFVVIVNEKEKFKLSSIFNIYFYQVNGGKAFEKVRSLEIGCPLLILYSKH